MVLRRELIGSKIRLLPKNTTGRIIDETKNTFVIKIFNKKKRILKKGNIFEFTLKNKQVTVDGSELIMRPEERIKLKG